ncbi:DNA methyltransferase [Chloroflexota bacterium]
MEYSDKLNGVCPYFTMFPLEFPLRILKRYARTAESVLDPFSGRGTTNYAARLLGMTSFGIDSSPVAFALTEAKLANATPQSIIVSAKNILHSASKVEVPVGDFWSSAYHATVLEALCKLRDALLQNCRSDSRKALRGILLGALHGPVSKNTASYFSNQCTRTYAPKPGYAVKYWAERHLEPPEVDVLEVIKMKAHRYYYNQRRAKGSAFLGDSREMPVCSQIRENGVNWIITSPPYYGMRTYLQDQWLRNWFVGGPSEIIYSGNTQLDHGSPEGFASQLRIVWENVSRLAAPDAKLVIRFGAIPDRSADPLLILKQSLNNSPWKLRTIKFAGSANSGRRQATQFALNNSEPHAEYDAWAMLRNRAN